MIYSFFEADNPERPGLGTFIILDHIQRSARVGLAYVYLGYWVEGAKRMEYKMRFQPLERLGPTGWHCFDAPPPARPGLFDPLPGNVQLELL